jgi:hypothetical protein
LNGRFPQVERQMAELREFMVQKRVPKHLRKSVREFMEQLYLLR